MHGQTRRLLDAYRRWSGAGPLPQLDELTIPIWRYPGFAAAGLEIPSPRLALFPRGDWDPHDEYRGEPDEPRPAFLADVIDAGVRPSFEMEQVLPGVDEGDWDSDPIVEAVDLHHAGFHRDAIRLLCRNRTLHDSARFGEDVNTRSETSLASRRWRTRALEHSVRRRA